MASTTLSRTPSSAGNRKTFTISAWVKRGNITSQQCLFSTGNGAGNPLNFIGFNSDKFSYWEYSNSTTNISDVQTNRLFRDTSAWYHIVVSVDTTQATASDRIKIYINGVQETSFSTSTYPSQNTDLGFNLNQVHDIGRYLYTGTAYFDGSMTHFHFIEGTAYTASTFGETDANGVWKPKTSPSVTYGTNGFFLKMENSSNMDLDSSPNNHTFTTSGNLTQTLDTPSNVYATLNPLYPYTSTGAFTNGNTAPSDYNVSQGIVGTLGASKGKWYFEVKASSTPTENLIGWGARDSGVINYAGSQAYDYCRYLGYATYYNNGSGTAISGASAYSGGDICGCAIDLDNNYIYWYKNGVLENSGGTAITASSTAGNYFPLVRNGNGSNIQCNFGNGYFGTTAVASAGSNGNGAIFEFDVPTGYYALNTKNLATYG